MFWIVSIIFVVVAGAFVLFPFWRHLRPVGEAQRLQTNLTIFEERRDELRTELENGNLDQQQYQALLVELEKTLLRDTESSGQGVEGTKDSKQPAGRTRFGQKAVPLGAVVLVCIIAYALYGVWGKYEEVQLMDLFEQTISSANDMEASRALVNQLVEIAQSERDNAWVNYFLGLNFRNLNMYEPAELAFKRASELLPASPDKAMALGQYAQFKYINSGGELNDEVMQIINQARAINPSEGTSLELLAFDAEMQQDYESAIRYWRLLIQAAPNSSRAQQLRNQIAEAQRVLEQRGIDEGDAGPAIDVRIELAEGLDLPPDLRVFVAARNAAQQNMPPLAAIDLVVGDLPTTVTLDNNMAVTPMANLSSADTIYISATVSLSGSATVGAGDYRVVSNNFAHNGQHSVIELVISDRVR